MDLRKLDWVGVVRQAWAKAQSDDLVQRSAALAFLTMVSLVPLLAALSYLGARAFSGAQDQLVAFLWSVLPYSEAAVQRQLSGFLEQAKSIRGFGFLGFLVTSLFAFIAVERTINRVWNVNQQRPFSVRLRSFTLVLFWGPLMIGAAYSSLFLLGRHPFLRPLVPFTISMVGLTVLYWLVPFTKVHLRNAAIGGLTAAVLLEMLRQGFGFYIGWFQRLSIIYGSFGLALLFMASIQLVWLIVLLGSEVAYCVQHRALFLHPRASTARVDASWLGLVALVAIVDHFRVGSPIMPRSQLCAVLRMEASEVDAVVEPLLVAGRLAPSSDGEGFLLACDPYQLPVAEVLGDYDKVPGLNLDRLSPDLVERLTTLRSALGAVRTAHLGPQTVAEIVAPPEVSKG